MILIEVWKVLFHGGRTLDVFRSKLKKTVLANFGDKAWSGLIRIVSMSITNKGHNEIATDYRSKN